MTLRYQNTHFSNYHRKNSTSVGSRLFLSTSYLLVSVCVCVWKALTDNVFITFLLCLSILATPRAPHGGCFACDVWALVYSTISHKEHCQPFIMHLSGDDSPFVLIAEYATCCIYVMRRRRPEQLDADFLLLTSRCCCCTLVILYLHGTETRRVVYFFVASFVLYLTAFFVYVLCCVFGYKCIWKCAQALLFVLLSDWA